MLKTALRFSSYSLNSSLLSLLLHNTTGILRHILSLYERKCNIYLQILLFYKIIRQKTDYAKIFGDYFPQSSQILQNAPVSSFIRTKVAVRKTQIRQADKRPYQTQATLPPRQAKTARQTPPRPPLPPFPPQRYRASDKQEASA